MSRRHLGRPTRVLIAACLSAILAVLSGASASACSCKVGTTAEQVARAGLVAEVVVEAVTATQSGSSGDLVVYTMRARRVFKGPASALFRVASASNGASCGLEGISVGATVVLFAQSAEPQAVFTPGPAAAWTADLCGGTALASAALIAEVTAVAGAARSSAPPPQQAKAPGRRGARVPEGRRPGLLRAGDRASSRRRSPSSRRARSLACWRREC